MTKNGHSKERPAENICAKIIHRLPMPEGKTKGEKEDDVCLFNICRVFVLPQTYPNYTINFGPIKTFFLIFCGFFVYFCNAL